MRVLSSRVLVALAGLALPVVVACGAPASDNQNDTTGRGGVPSGPSTNPDEPQQDAGSPGVVVTPPTNNNPPNDAGPGLLSDGGLSDGGSEGGKGDGGKKKDAGSDAAPDAGDPYDTNVNGCGVYEDYRGVCDAQRAVFVIDGEGFAPRCIAIEVGQSLGFVDEQGGFQRCALAPSGGDPGNPIPTLNGGDVVTVTFPTSGIYGFHCTNVNGDVYAGAVAVLVP